MSERVPVVVWASAVVASVIAMGFIWWLAFEADVVTRQFALGVGALFVFAACVSTIVTWWAYR